MKIMRVSITERVFELTHEPIDSQEENPALIENHLS